MVKNNMSHVLDIKPRVIAAEVKSPIRRSPPVPHQSKPRIAGELDLVGETTSEPHYVEVRDGALLVYPGRSREAYGSAVWRLPLRYLNLQPASSGRPRGFSLSRHGESVPLATFQVGCEPEYEKWVKTLAAELMRQTPLDAVRFLDILGITATLSSPSNSPTPLRRVYSADSVRQETTTPRSRISSTACSAIQEEEMSNAVVANVAARGTRSLQRPRKSTKGIPSVPLGVNLSMGVVNNTENTESTRIRSRIIDCSKDKTEYVKNLENASLPDVIRDLPPCERRSRARSRVDKSRRMRNLSAEPLVSSLSDETVTKLMALCQQDDRYVPVRDKRLLFETLCRRRFVCSTDNISLPCTEPGSLAGQPRAQSLHDLSDCNSVVVKDICKYFERGGPPISNLTNKKRTLSEQRQSHRNAHNRHNIICLRLTGEALWRFQQQSTNMNIRL